MTKAYSELNDNGGCCERCNDPATINQVQTAHKIFLGGGLGWGTLWLCPKCAEEKKNSSPESKSPTSCPNDEHVWGEPTSACGGSVDCMKCHTSRYVDLQLAKG